MGTVSLGRCKQTPPLSAQDTNNKPKDGPIKVQLGEPMNWGGSFTEQGEGWPSEHGLGTLEEPCHCLVSPRMGGDAPEAASVECAFSHLLLCLNANTFREYKTTGQLRTASRQAKEGASRVWRCVDPPRSFPRGCQQAAGPSRDSCKWSQLF